MKRLWSALKWWWSGEGLSAPDVLIAREDEQRWREQVMKLREDVKSFGSELEAKDRELTICKRDIVLLSEIIKREQVRVQAKTYMAHQRMEARRE